MSSATVNESSFDVHVVGDVTQKTWKGTFAAKQRLSLRDRLQKDQLRRDFLGTDPTTAGVEATNIALLLSELRVRLTKYPEWWGAVNFGSELEDENLVLEIFQKAMDVEKDAANAVKQAAKAVEAEVKDYPNKKEL